MKNQVSNCHLRILPITTRAIAAWIISRSGDVRTDNCQLRYGMAELAFDRAEARAHNGTVRCRFNLAANVCKSSEYARLQRFTGTAPVSGEELFQQLCEGIFSCPLSRCRGIEINR